MKGFTVTDKNWCVCVSAYISAHFCLYIYVYIYLFIKMTDFAKAGGKEEGWSHYPIQVFLCPFTVYASVCTEQICAHPHNHTVLCIL